MQISSGLNHLFKVIPDIKNKKNLYMSFLIQLVEGESTCDCRTQVPLLDVQVHVLAKYQLLHVQIYATAEHKHHYWMFKYMYQPSTNQYMYKYMRLPNTRTIIGCSSTCTSQVLASTCTNTCDCRTVQLTVKCTLCSCGIVFIIHVKIVQRSTMINKVIFFLEKQEKIRDDSVIIRKSIHVTF